MGGTRDERGGARERGRGVSESEEDRGGKEEQSE